MSPNNSVCLEVGKNALNSVIIIIVKLLESLHTKL